MAPFQVFRVAAPALRLEYRWSHRATRYHCYRDISTIIVYPVRDFIFHLLVLSVREHLKDTYFAVFLSVSEDLIISSRGSIEKLYKSNIVCVCVCVCVCVRESHVSELRYPRRTIRAYFPGLNTLRKA